MISNKYKRGEEIVGSQAIYDYTIDSVNLLYCLPLKGFIKQKQKIYKKLDYG